MLALRRALVLQSCARESKFTRTGNNTICFEALFHNNVSVYHVLQSIPLILFKQNVLKNAHVLQSHVNHRAIIFHNDGEYPVL